MPRADKPMSKQPTRAGAIDFSFDLLTIATLNALKKAREILEFKGEGKDAKIKRPGTTRFTDVKNKVNTDFLEKKFKQNPQAFTPEKPKKPEEKPKKPEEEIPEEELKDKPSDIRRQEEARKKAEEEARLKAEEEAKLKPEKATKKAKKKAKKPEEISEEDKISMDHPLNKLLMNLSKEKNPLTQKKILAAARRVYNNHEISRTLPKKIIAPSKGTFFKRKDSALKKLLAEKEEKHTTSYDKARVLRSDLIDDLKEMGGYESIPEADREAFLYYVASYHVRDPEQAVREYIGNRQAFMAKILRGWQATGNRPAYEAMSRDGVNIDAMTEDMVDDYETRKIFEPEPEPEPEPEQEPAQPEPEFGMPEGARRFVLQPEMKGLIQELNTADSDDEKKRAVDRFMENPEVQRVARGAENAADFINLFRGSPAWDAMSPVVKELVTIAATAYITTRFTGTRDIDETDPVKVEAELNRLREQLQNLRVAKLNEEQEEQSFKERRKFRPEIREFNPERLNYFVSQEHENLEKRELIDFAYIPEVSQAGVYTEDYKDNPLVMGNIQNENIRFTNTQKQPVDYHPVGTYMLLDRIGKQMLEIRKEFNKAVQSMRHQQRAVDDQFNQVWIPRIPPTEQPRKRRYRDMTDDASKFASEPIVSLPKIDDNGVGATSAHKDFITSYSYRRHYIK